jgi:hypothetical protein
MYLYIIRNFGVRVHLFYFFSRFSRFPFHPYLAYAFLVCRKRRHPTANKRLYSLAWLQQNHARIQYLKLVNLSELLLVKFY